MSYNLISALKHLMLILMLVASTFLISQNLVPNPSFEDTVACPTNPGHIYRATSWLSCNQYSPDYFNSCSPSYYSVPNNIGGYQQAYNGGSGYAGIGTYEQSVANYREIIGAFLNSPLSIGTKYYLSMRVSLSINNNITYPSSHASDKLGMLFSTHIFSSSTPAPINNFAHFYTSTIITDTLSWIEVSGSFVADSVYTFVAIGNFFDDLNTNIEQVYPPGSSGPNSFYYIEDVCVSQDSLTCHISTFNKKIENEHKINIYPNPTNRKINIDLGGYQSNISVTLINYLGQVIYTENHPYTNLINLEINGPKGIYFLGLESDNNDFITRKIVKQ